jgi:alpha-tubulin suppressor-like RCC1 family protein
MNTSHLPTFTESLLHFARRRLSTVASILVTLIAFGNSPASIAAKYSQFSAGSYHTCALVDSGEVFCWGRNEWGQLGNNTLVDSAVPVQVHGITEAIAVSSGFKHTCALLASGRIRCWGDNTLGQLGNGSLVSSAIPTTVSNITTAISLSVGSEIACAVLASGAIRCWGDGGTAGALGNGTTGVSNTPVTVSSITTAVSVAAGSNHVCAALADLTARCWGSNASGQLGRIGGDSSTPVAVTGVSSVTAIQAAEFFSCAQLASGQVRCWGDNSDGGLGDGNSPTDSATAVTVRVQNGALTPPLTEVIQLSLSSVHSCVLRSSALPYCWGNNFYGQLGDGTKSDRDLATPVTGVGAPVQISGGFAHTCILFASGNVQCWGDNRYGQLGVGITEIALRPQAVIGLTSATRITARERHACALLSSGAVQCWGENAFGRLGNNSTVSASAPVIVSNLAGATGVSAGWSHTCAVRNVSGNGSAQCWGNNGDRQLGNGTTATSLVPENVSSTNTYVSIASGFEHTCAVASTGGIFCWGSNLNGQLGNNDPGNNSSVPVAVTGITTAAGVDTGNNHSCAVLTGAGGGGVQCWGSDGSGQIGDTLVGGSRPVPTSVSGMTTAVEVTTGQFFSCARLFSGSVRCWGRNAEGQLGNNTTTSSETPVTVQDITAAIAVRAGERHVCAVVAGGSVYCWGSNDRGQLGNFSTDDSPIPVKVANINNAVSVAAGDAFSCALLADGTARCWGDNRSGQVGDGTAQTPTSRPWLTAESCTLDLDGNGVVSANTDGVMLVRALLGFGGTSVTNAALGANAVRASWAEIRSHLSLSCGLQGLAP